MDGRGRGTTMAVRAIALPQRGGFAALLLQGRRRRTVPARNAAVGAGRLLLPPNTVQERRTQLVWLRVARPEVCGGARVPAVPRVSAAEKPPDLLPGPADEGLLEEDPYVSPRDAERQVPRAVGPKPLFGLLCAPSHRSSGGGVRLRPRPRRLHHNRVHAHGSQHDEPDKGPRRQQHGTGREGGRDQRRDQSTGAGGRHVGHFLHRGDQQRKTARDLDALHASGVARATGDTILGALLQQTLKPAQKGAAVRAVPSAALFLGRDVRGGPCD